MKIALIADIHANLPALEAVLKDARDQHVDEIWCLGDVIGYGPFPNECVRLVQQACARVILGNHDDKVASIDKIQCVMNAAQEDHKAFVFRWTHQALGRAERDYLQSLPKQAQFTLMGRRIGLYHGSPDGMNDALTPYTPSARLEALAQKAEADLMLVAHSHDVFSRKVKSALFINPGAVGRPFDQDLRANYAVLDLDEAKATALFRRVEYDIAPCLVEMQEKGFSAHLVRALEQARSPADLLPEGIGEDLMVSVEKLGASCGLKKPHALQVTRLSLKLFDALKEMHGLGDRERTLLHLGAYLHDIGLCKGPSGHHKESRDIILAAQKLALSPREQTVAALIARYHRRAFPTSQHKHFLYLPDHHKMLVERLAALVRMADGLDRSHQSLVSDVKAEIVDDEVLIQLTGKGAMPQEVEFGKIKADLFEKVYARKVRFLVRGKTGTFSVHRGC